MISSYKCQKSGDIPSSLITLVVLLISLFSSLTVFSQSDLLGLWETGEDNTKIEISETNGLVQGKIFSSENEKAKIGKVILKDLKEKSNSWSAQLYAAKRKRWVDAEMTPKKDILELTISVGMFSKALEWKRAQ